MHEPSYDLQTGTCYSYSTGARDLWHAFSSLVWITRSPSNIGITLKLTIVVSLGIVMLCILLAKSVEFLTYNLVCPMSGEMRSKSEQH